MCCVLSSAVVQLEMGQGLCPAQSLSFLEGSGSMFLEGFRLGPVLGSAFIE